MNRQLPNNPSPSVRKRNPHLWSHLLTEKTLAEKTIEKRIRQSSHPLLNRLEQEFWNHITSEWKSYSFCAQCLRFRLGNGIWYKPDIACLNWMPGRIACWEVKGQKAFRGGFENLKVAAHQYPQITWFLVWKDKPTQTWKEQLVLP